MSFPSVTSRGAQSQVREKSAHPAQWPTNTQGGHLTEKTGNKLGKIREFHYTTGLKKINKFLPTTTRQVQGMKNVLWLK